MSDLNPEPLELLVQIGPDHGQGHVVMVRSSTGATASGTFYFPITPEQLRELTALLEDGARPTSFDVYDSPLSLRIEEHEAERFGGDLFRRLFSRTIRPLWDSSLAIAAERQSHLKLRLEFDLQQESVVPLVSLPWELLFDPDTRTFLALGRTSTLLRSFSVAQPLRPLPRPRPLRVLVVLGDSWGLVNLDLEREIQILETRLAEHREVEMEIVQPHSYHELTTAIRSRDFHVLHYMGHGHFDPETGEGYVYLRNGETRVEVNGDDLAAALRDRASHLVILNACETGRTAIGAAGHPFAGLAAALVLAGVPSVVAMQVPIRDSASFAMTEAFYRHLLRNEPVEIALTEARIAVRAEYPRKLDWAIPVLYSRSPDSRLFVFAEASPEIRTGIIDASHYIEEKSRDIHGREWLLEKIDRFVAERPCGHVILRGDPGIGKSSMLARLVQRDGCIHHFNIRSEGTQRPEQFLENVCSQLIAKYSLEYPSLPPEATRSAGFLNKLLSQVSAGLRAGEKLIIVVDALDESDTTHLAPGANPLYLPSSPPPGIYFVLSARRDEHLFLRIDGEQAPINLYHDSIENEGDVRTFVASWLYRPAVEAFLVEREADAPGFMQEIVGKSQGNFMYLRHILREIESGTWRNRSLKELPDGLQSYYEDHWRRLRARDERSWLTVHLPVLVALTVVREPVSLELLASFSGLSDHRKISSVLREWAPFLHVNEAQRYRLYHDSFQRFIADKDEVAGERVHLTKAHERIVGSFDEIWRDLTFSAAAREAKEGLATSREILDYSFRHTIGHLFGRHKHQELLSFLEKHEYLVRQVTHCKGFRQTGEDLESFILPATIEERDWKRFARYSTVALNLRGLAEDLAEWTILRALVQGGQSELAADLAQSVPDPLRRVVAQAAIASACDPGVARQMLSDIRQDWKEPLAQTSDASELRRRSDLLAQMARCFGPELVDRWPIWIKRAGLSPDLADLVWRAVTESWLDRGDVWSQELWKVLRKIAPETLLRFLPQRLAVLTPDQPDRIRGELRGLFGTETRTSHLAWMRFLGHLSQEHAEIAIPAWESWLVDEEVSWSPALIEAGHPLWASLPPERLETFAAGLAEPVTVAALRVCRQEDALEIIERIPDGPEKLHWVLRSLEARPTEPQADVRGRLAGIGRYLDALRYEAAPEDLRRYLDLIGSYFPDKLTFQMDNVIWSQGGTPELLRELARNATSDAVWSHLEKRAAAYAAAVAPHLADSFLLRAEVRIEAICRLCIRRENLAPLEDAKNRLLQPEEDDLRCALAPLLKAPDLARAVCEGIADPRRRLITRLATIGIEDLKPPLLYETVRNEALAHEIEGLLLLCEDPRDARRLMEEAFETLADSDERAAAFLRLGWHALAAQARPGSRWDPEALFDLIRPGLIFENHERLAILTPDIAALGAQTGGRRARAEVQGAFARLSGLETVALPVRRQAAGRLLRLLPDVFLRLIEHDPAKAKRQTARVLAQISRQPDRLEPEPAGTEPIRSPSDAGAEPALRRIWEGSSDAARQEHARLVIDALRWEGKPRAEAVLRWWFHVHVAPRLGEAHPEGRRLAQDLAAALSLAQALGKETA